MANERTFVNKSCYVFVCVFIFTLTVVKGDVKIEHSKCPGRYCGRLEKSDGNFSSCGACPRGYKPDDESICHKCKDSPLLYDWLYLGFMAILSPALHWFFIDFTNKRKNGKLFILHAFSLIESVLACISTLLVSEPIGSFSLTSCPVEQLSDWYTMFYNPRPGYTTTLHCTQEAVYPLYTMVMIYYAFCLALMMIFRPLVSMKCTYSKGTKSIYAALYFFPVLVVVHAVFGGLIYYAFPYILIVVSTVTNAIHFAYFEEQSFKYILKQTFSNPRNLIILLCHWILHAYGIISITQLTEPAIHGPVLFMILFPFAFYVLTVHFTDPDNIEALT